MNVEKIQTKIITPKTTGYSAAAGIGLSICTAYSKNNYIAKMHKPFAFITVLLTLMHIGLIEYYQYRFKKLQSSKNN